jgi:hypothetical protein
LRIPQVALSQVIIGWAGHSSFPLVIRQTASY